MKKFVAACLSPCTHRARLSVVNSILQTKSGCTRSTRQCYSVLVYRKPVGFHRNFEQKSHPLSSHWRSLSCRPYSSLGNENSQKQSDSTISKGKIRTDNLDSNENKVNVGNAPPHESTDLPLDDSQLSIFQRFKNAYKEYGKCLIGVHVATSVVWFGGFYYAALTGVDVVPLLQKLGVGETVISKFTDSQVGNLAIAYLLYEIAKPVRYFVTLAGTRQTIVFLRKRGYMEPVPKDARIRELYKESREQFKEKRIEFQDKLKEDKISGIYKERKEQFKEKQGEWKEKLKDMTNKSAKEK